MSRARELHSFLSSGAHSQRARVSPEQMSALAASEP